MLKKPFYNYPCAIFDLDGTLLLGPSSEARFVLYLTYHRILPISNITLWLFYLFKTFHMRTDKMLYRGLNAEKIKEIAKYFAENYLKHSISKQGLEYVRREKESGKKIILLSGTPEFLLKPLNRFIGADLCIGLRLEESEGKFTGRYKGTYPFGIGKLKILQELGCDLKNSSGYGNHISDRYFLEAVAKGYCVNPGPGFRKVCKLKNMEILKWTF